MLGLGHQLVATRDAQLAHAAEVALEAPHALVGVEDRVVVARRLLERDVVRVHENAIAGLPATDGGARPQHDAAGVGADDVRRYVVASAVAMRLRQPLEEREGGHRLEDRRPHGVVVHARGEGRDEHLVGRELRRRHLADLERERRALLLTRELADRLGVLGAQVRADVGLGDGDRAEVVAARPGGDGRADGAREVGVDRHRGARIRESARRAARAGRVRRRLRNA